MKNLLAQSSVFDDTHFDYPSPKNAPREEIELFAEQKAEQLNFQPGDSLEPLVTDLLGFIDFEEYGHFTEAVDASIYVFEDKSFRIRLPMHTSPKRDRFSIAHELGHLFLHYPQVESGRMRAYRHDSNPVEWEANWFAAAFLMPKRPFCALFESLQDISPGDEIPLLARNFGVSSTAARIRARRFGLSF